MNFKHLFCRHKENKIICWHWTHGVSGNKPLFLEIQMKCLNCGKIYYKYIKDREKCYNFIVKYPNKQWSTTCKPKG